MTEDEEIRMGIAETDRIKRIEAGRPWLTEDRDYLDFCNCLRACGVKLRPEQLRAEQKAYWRYRNASRD